MPKSIEDIDRQIAALKEQKKRQQAQIAQKKREGLRSCKELIGEEVVNAFNNWSFCHVYFRACRRNRNLLLDF